MFEHTMMLRIPTFLPTRPHSGTSQHTMICTYLPSTPNCVTFQHTKCVVYLTTWSHGVESQHTKCAVYLPTRPHGFISLYVAGVYEDVLWYVQMWGIWKGKEEGCRLEEEVRRKGRSRRKSCRQEWWGNKQRGWYWRMWDRRRKEKIKGD